MSQSQPNSLKNQQHPIEEDEEGEEDMNDSILAQSQGAGNTFIGNTVRPQPNASADMIAGAKPKGEGMMQKSDPQGVFNRFKDSVEPGGLGGAGGTVGGGAPSQNQVQTVIDSYQQQIKDFKKTVNQLDQRLSGSGMQPISDQNATVLMGSHYNNMTAQEGASEFEDGYVSTFRTEMMSKGAMSGPRVPQPHGRAPPSEFNPMSNAQSIGMPLSSAKPQQPGHLQVPNQYQDTRGSIQTVGGKQSMAGGFHGAVDEQSQGTISQGGMDQSSRSYGQPQIYQTTFPDFRQDSRPSFNVDFAQDTKPQTLYQQQPGSQSYGGGPPPISSYQQSSAHEPMPGSQQHMPRFSQDSKPQMPQKPSTYALPSDHPSMIQNQQTSQHPQYQQQQESQYLQVSRQQQEQSRQYGSSQNYGGPPSSVGVQQQQLSYGQQTAGSQYVPSHHSLSQRPIDDQTMRDTQKFRDTGGMPYSDTNQVSSVHNQAQQHLQAPYDQSVSRHQEQSFDDSYRLPPKKEPAPYRMPVPREQLLTAEQKALLGQRNETMERKLDQPLLTKLMMNNNNKDDEDEMAQTNAYYNFDGGYVKPENLAIGRNKMPQPPQQVQRQQHAQEQQPVEASIHDQQMNETMRAAESEKHGQQMAETMRTQKSAHSQQQPHKELTMDEMAFLKEQFLEQEERDRLNPQNMLIRVLFIHAFNSQYDSEQAAFEEATTDRKLYSFFINKVSKVQDLKMNHIKKEFGFDLDQQKLYFKYKEINNQQAIMDIEAFDIEEDILTLVTINSPKTHIPIIVREPLDDIKIADVRLLNSRDRNEQIKGGEQVFDMERFDIDQEKLPWPAYRDWTAEAAFLSNIIVRDKAALLNDEQQFMIQQGFTKHLLQSTELAELAEAEAAFRKLADDFRKASLYAVHLVVKKNPTPLNLFNLYGDDGDKYVVGGILVRRAKDWTICGQPFTDKSRLQTTAMGPNGDAGQSLAEISGKIAALDVRNMATLRNRIARLVVPLACIVDYYGLRFECQSLAPLSINSLVYGSDTNGLTFSNRDEHAEMIAKLLASMLNIKPHYIEEQATGKLKLAHLPYTVQLHRNKDLQDDVNLYLVNPFRLFPQDESLRQNTQPGQNSTAQVPFQEIMSKQLRPELVSSNNKGEPDPECQYFTWRKPTRCDECQEWINDYEYYYFEKKSVDKTQRLLAQYYCCINCYMERLPTENFKYPINKIVKKELPHRDRLQFYQNMQSGKKHMSVQYSRVPLNPDAYFHLSNGQADKISDQEEILRAAQKLKDEVLTKLVDDLNNVDEDPQNGESLENMLHSRGINFRTIGRVCTAAELNHVRELCVIEVIARSAKLLIKDGLTFLADDEEAGFQTVNIKKCVLHYLLEIFNTDDNSNSQQSVQTIWDFITEHARKKFQVTVEKDVLSKINMNGLFISIISKLNIKLRKSLREIDFFQVSPETGQKNFLVLEDILAITPLVKDYTDKQPNPFGTSMEQYPCSLNIILEAARVKDSQGKRSQWYMRGGEEREESTELYRMACSISEQVYGQRSMRYARVLKEFAEHLESRHQEKGRPENSRWNRSFAIVEDDLSSESRFFYNTSLQTMKDINQEISIESAQIYVALARLVKPRSANSLRGDTDSQQYEVYQNLMSAVELYELLLGFDHPETGDTYTKMALAYQEQGNFAAASPWIRRAFTVFYKAFGPHDVITQSAYEQLKSIETNVDSKLDQVPYEDLPHVIFEIEKQQKLQADQQQQMAMLGHMFVAPHGAPVGRLNSIGFQL